MRARKRIEEALGADRKIGELTDDLDTLFELGREGEHVEPEIARDAGQRCRPLQMVEMRRDLLHRPDKPRQLH